MRTLCDVNSTVERSRHETRGRVAWSNDHTHELIAKCPLMPDRFAAVSITDIDDSNAAPTNQSELLIAGTEDNGIWLKALR